MKRIIVFCFVLIFPALVLAGFWTRKGDRPATSAVFEKIKAEELHNPDVAKDLKTACTVIGHRLTGSENGKKAEQFAFDLFKQYGFKDVAFQEFEVNAWKRETVSLTLYYSGKDTASVAASHSFPAKLDPTNAGCVVSPDVVSLANTPLEADVFKPVLDAGNGLKSDFEKLKDSIPGKIVVLNLGISPKDSTLKNLHRSEKAALAIAYGAAGCIFINNVEGRILLTGTASVNEKLIAIPAVCITLEDGLSLRQCMRLPGHPCARMRMKNNCGPIKARNVVATLKGTEWPGEEILLCGHLDSWDLATGAIDNGIGSFTVLEIARVFEKLKIKPRRTIRFITFMGEEQGLLGSKAYVQYRNNNHSLGQIRYVLNLDMAGNTRGFNASGRPEMESFIKQVMAEIQTVEPSFAAIYKNTIGLHSDHQSFLEQGIPTIGSEGNLDASVYKYYHSNQDNFNLVNPEHMSRCATFSAMLVYALSEASKIPAVKLSDTQTRDFFIKAGLKEELILGGEWRWEK